MPFNGSGTYTLPAGNPVVTNTDISSTTQNNTMSDVATALTDCVTRDGQSPATANLPLGGFKLTGLGAGSALTDSATLGQVQNELGNYGGTAGGTANALTISTSPAITAYAAGQRFWFKASASGNSGATTLNIDGLGAIAVQFNGVACVGGEILANNFYQVFLDTTTSCQISPISSLSSAGGTLTGALNNAPSVVLASATSTAIGAAASNNITISGTTTITSFDTIAEGAIRLVTFSGAVPITYDATKMQLVGAASRTYAVGDVSLFRSLGSGNWKEEFYQPVGGYAALAGLSTQLFAVKTPATTDSIHSAVPVDYFTPINNSSASSDLSLGVDQSAYIDVSAATSVPLYIATGDNQEYELTFAMQGGGNTAASSTLEPNNTTYGTAINNSVMDASGSTLSGVNTNNGYFYIIYGVDGNFNKTTITTKTISKNLSALGRGVISASTIYQYWLEGHWNDTTTIWSSLGTLAFPVAATGRIYIKRVA